MQIERKSQLSLPLPLTNHFSELEKRLGPRESSEPQSLSCFFSELPTEFYRMPLRLLW